MIHFQSGGSAVGCEVRLILGAVGAKDPSTANHSERVAILARELATRLELPKTLIKEVYLAGLLHDVGKLGIPDSVLGKPGALDEEEFDLIRRHPCTGEMLLRCIDLPINVVRGILEHHERPDGRGYPYSLTAPELSITGRILKVADVFDALCSERPYKPAISQDEAYRILAAGAGSEFDPIMVAALLRHPFNYTIPAA